MCSFAKKICFFFFSFCSFGNLAQAAQVNNGYDEQNLRPTMNSQDLIVLPSSQSQPYLSPSVGAFLQYNFRPLVLYQLPNDEIIRLVDHRTQLDLGISMGIFRNWIEVGAYLPIIFYQQSDLLESIGREEHIRSTTVGDLSLLGKVSLVHRAEKAPGLGFALGLRSYFPTGSMNDFTGDGKVTFHPTAIIDYRFANRLLIGLQTGVFFRPETQLGEGLVSGNTWTLSAGGSIPIPKKPDLSILVGAYLHVPLRNITNKGELPAEVLASLRWSNEKLGITLTPGVAVGINCGVGAPFFRIFAEATWEPRRTKKAIDPTPPPPPIEPILPILPILPPQPPLPKKPPCPTEPGVEIPPGCSRLIIDYNSIKFLQPIHFATDQDSPEEKDFSLLDEAARLLQAHPEIELISLEGHCDDRADDTYNLKLSQRRANFVEKYLISNGVSPKRLQAKGFGRSRPQATNKSDEGKALNRRVEFKIMKRKKASLQ